MEQFVLSLKVSQATLFSFMLKSWNFHWNVTGPQFHDYHAFFGEIYEQSAARVDVVAELIRQTDNVAPGALSKFMELSKITDTITDISAPGMITELMTDNTTVCNVLTEARNNAEEMQMVGIQNDLEDLIAQCHKLGWMLKSSR